MGALASMGKFLKTLFVAGWLAIMVSIVPLHVWYGVIGAFFRPADGPAADAPDAEPCPSCAWCGGASAHLRPVRAGQFAPSSARSAPCAHRGDSG